VRSIKSSPARLKDLIDAAETTKTQTKLEVIQVAGSLLDTRTVRRCDAVFGITPTYLYGSTEVGTVTRGLFKAEAPNNLGAPVDDIDFEVVAHPQQNNWLHRWLVLSGRFCFDELG